MKKVIVSILAISVVYLASVVPPEPNSIQVASVVPPEPNSIQVASIVPQEPSKVTLYNS